MEMEMESQNFGHMHPMVFNEEQSNQTKEANCSRCGELVSGPSFSCAECGFSLHKKCVEAPSKIDHPFHRNHPLVLLPKPPYSGRCICDFCGETCEFFVYHCSCGLYFHIKCALFTLNIAEKKLGVHEHIATKDPSISPEDGNKELENAECFGCWVPLGESTYSSFDCGFNLHKKCAELPHEVNHPFHKEHPLFLQFNGERFSCYICKKTQRKGFVYCCSPCKFALHIKCADLPTEINHLCHRIHPLVLQFNSENLPCMTCQKTQNKEFVYCCSPCKFSLHIECASPPPTIKEKNHQHPFTLFWRQASFICDACGLEGNYVAYICAKCNLLIHQKCISLPPIIRVPRHHHPIVHNYFLSGNKFKNWECGFCDTEVNVGYGSYYCSYCNFITHVKCATEKKGWYYVTDARDKDEKHDDDLALFTDISVNPITCVIEQNEGGEMTRIKHFSHAHDLILSDNIMENDKTCDGCMLLISNSFYYCSSRCDFFLHKACAESLRKKHLWFHRCLQPLILVVGYIFKCDVCLYECSGFSYKCNEYDVHYCLRCAVSGYRITHQGHKHHLFFIRNYEGGCNACGKKCMTGPFRCKRCNFNLDRTCLMLPLTTRHKCDEHPLVLTYHEGNDYSEYHYCDICEKERDPNLWFYHCATCEFSAHPMCVLGSSQLIKPGSTYKEKDHPHPLTFVQKTYDYPAGCRKCFEPCQGLALECAESTCNYIVHWECVRPRDFSTERPVALYKTQTDVIAHDVADISNLLEKGRLSKTRFNGKGAK